MLSIVALAALSLQLSGILLWPANTQKAFCLGDLPVALGCCCLAKLRRWTACTMRRMKGGALRIKSASLVMLRKVNVNK